VRPAVCSTRGDDGRLVLTDHITLTGRYRIALPEQLRDRGTYRELATTAVVAA